MPAVKRFCRLMLASLLLGSAVVFAIFLYGPLNFLRAARAEKFQYVEPLSERLGWVDYLLDLGKSKTLFRIRRNGWLGDFLDNLQVINADYL